MKKKKNDQRSTNIKMLDIDYQGHVMAKDKILYYCLKK